MKKYTLPVFFLCLLFFVGCSDEPPTAEPTQVVAVVADEMVGETAVSPTAVPTVSPTSTLATSATPFPTNTPTATVMMTPSPIPSPTTSLWNSIPKPEISFQPEVDLVVVDQAGGVVRAVTVNNKHALIGVGPRLWTIDISDPANPVKIGQTDIFPGVVQDVVWAEDTAFVATKENGIWLVNMHDTQSPQITDFFEMPHLVTDLKIQNDLLLALGREIPRGRDYDLPDQRYLSLIDVQDINRFQIVNTVPIDGEVHSWSWLDDTVFLMKRGLAIVDIANPQTPILNQIPEIHERAVVALSDHELYLVGNFGIKKADISDPDNLVELDPGKSNVFPGLNIADFEIDEQLLFITGNFCDAGSCGSSLQIHDVYETGYPELSSLSAGFLSYDLFIQNGYAYIATEDGLNIVDVRDPYSAQSVSWLPTTGRINHVSMEKDRVGGINRDTYSLFFFPLASPEQLSTPIPFNPEYTDMVEVLLIEDEAYLSTGIGYAWGDLRILDAVDMLNPVVIGTYLPEEYPSGVRETVVQGEYAYSLLTGITREKDDQVFSIDLFAIIDISDPKKPYGVGEMSFPNNSFFKKSLAVDHEIAYLTRENLLISISIADPEAPQVIGELFFDEETYLQSVKTVCKGVLVIEDRKSTHEDELLLIDTTVIDDMRIISRLPIPDDVHNIAIEYPYAYVSGENLWVVDISDPSALRLVGVSQTPGNLQHVDVQDGIVYAADSEAGLLVLRVDELLQP